MTLAWILQRILKRESIPPAVAMAMFVRVFSQVPSTVRRESVGDSGAVVPEVSTGAQGVTPYSARVVSSTRNRFGGRVETIEDAEVVA